MVGLEQGEVDIDRDPARLEELDLGPGQRVRLGGRRGIAEGLVDLAEGDDVLGQGQDVRRLLEPGTRLLQVTAPTARRPSPAIDGAWSGKIASAV